jgi:hypothetical protein
MSFLLRKTVLVAFLMVSTLGRAQAWKFWKRDKEKSEQIGPKEAAENKAAAAEKQQNEYSSRKKTHLKAQDRQTRKRMKRTLRHAERYSWGKEAPWYKRWFGRRGGKANSNVRKKNLL